MNLFQNLGSWVLGGLRRRTGVQYAEPGGYAEASASPVTFDTAMQLSAVWACVKLISETVASLPLHVWEVRDGRRQLADTHPLAILLGGRINRYQNRIEFFETLLLNLLTHGNAYCVIQRTGDRITGLLPIMSSQVETSLLDDGAVVHEYTHDQGVTVYAADSVWHIKMFGNGIIGMSPLAHQRNTLGIAQAAEGAVSKIYRNGAKPSGVLTLDKFLTPEQREQIRKSFVTLTASTDDRLMVLEGGMKFDAISLSPQDIELLQSRQFQISEICRWYGVPSVMVNDHSGSTVWGSGISEIVAGFYKVTLRPILEKLEESMRVNLVGAEERGRIEIEFDFDALLRADMKSRVEAYRVAIASGVMTPNEARAAERMDPLPGGDRLLIQGAMMPVEQAGQFANAPQDDELLKAIKSAPPPAEPMVLNVHLKAGDTHVTTGDTHMPDVKANVQVDGTVVNVPPAEVKYTAPEIKVDVAAPNVTVAAPEVNVEVEATLPPPEVNVNLPARKTESTIERDSTGRITKTTQIETDL